MNRRLLILGLIVLLLVSAAVAFRTTSHQTEPVSPPPVEVPVPSVQQKEPQQQDNPAMTGKEEELEELLGHTLKTPLQKDQLIPQQSPTETTLTIKKSKPREIVPGVTVENKELRIQLEQANESLHIRRSNNEQVQMLWKQKF